jgi:hypothetical protein
MDASSRVLIFFSESLKVFFFANTYRIMAPKHFEKLVIGNGDMGR